jgi:chorismate synthase
MLRLLTAGESHGPGLTAILEGLPASVPISIKTINEELSRRQQGYGRGGRQQIEKDTVDILSGIRHGLSIGSPIAVFVENKDFENWKLIMSAHPVKEKITPVTKLRPGHADYAGTAKYGFDDIRPILERSSARTTAVQVAIGSICKQFLSQLKIKVTSKIVSVAEIAVNSAELNAAAKKRIDKAKTEGDSLGGIIELKISGTPIGLGSHVQNDRKLDGRLAGALMGMQAVKGVEIGLGFEAARLVGSKVHDPFDIKSGKIVRTSNNAGGIEGGMSNGEDIVLRIAIKPIPTMINPLPTVDLKTRKKTEAHVERADVCAVESAGVIAESLAAFEIAKAFLEKFGGDSLAEVLAHLKSI